MDYYDGVWCDVRRKDLIARIDKIEEEISELDGKLYGKKLQLEKLKLDFTALQEHQKK